MKLQELHEAVIKKWDVKDADIYTAINFLNESCKDGLESIQQGSLLYRGFVDEPSDKDFVIIDSSNSIRTSRDSNNLYQLMMEAALPDVPSRSASIICSTNMYTASMYSNLSIPPRVIIPVDETILALSDVEDFKDAMLASPAGDAQYMCIDDLSDSMKDAVTKLGLPKTEFDSSKELINLFARTNPFAVCLELFKYSLEFKGKNATELEDMSHQGSSNDLFKLAEIIAKNPEVVKPPAKFNKLLALLQNAPPKERFRVVSSTFFPSAKSVGISLIRFENKLPADKEVWFSGKCVAIKLPMMISIVQQMVKQNMKVDKQLIASLEGFFK